MVDFSVVFSASSTLSNFFSNFSILVAKSTSKSCKENLTNNQHISYKIIIIHNLVFLIKKGLSRTRTWWWWVNTLQQQYNNGCNCFNMDYLGRTWVSPTLIMTTAQWTHRKNSMYALVSMWLTFTHICCTLVSKNHMYGPCMYPRIFVRCMYALLPTCMQVSSYSQVW